MFSRKYRASCLSASIIKSTMNTVIWLAKIKIKSATIFGEKKNGGLKVCDFKITEKALKIAWINRIQDDSDASWKIIPNDLVHKHGSLSFPTKCDYATNTLDLKNLPTFYKKFKKSSGYGITTHLKNEVLWNNCNILVDNKPNKPTKIGSTPGLPK